MAKQERTSARVAKVAGAVLNPDKRTLHALRRLRSGAERRCGLILSDVHVKALVKFVERAQACAASALTQVPPLPAARKRSRR